MSSTNILETLSGFWSLRRITRINPTTKSFSPSTTFGPSPTGTILYHSSGYMSVIITSTIPSPDQIMSALSYSGPYKVLKCEAGGGPLASGRISHGPLLASISPEIVPVGTSLERDFVVEKDNDGKMVLKLSLEVDGKEGKEREELEWKKVA